MNERVFRKLATSVIASLIVGVAIAACGSSGTSGDDASDPDASMTGDGSGSGSANSDGGVDAPPVSHAPCPTCCDPIAQTGCGTGEACYQGDGTDTYCAAAGTKMTLGACNSDSECAAGFDCFTAFHNCRKFCTTDADCPSVTPQCALGTKPPENPYGLCL